MAEVFLAKAAGPGGFEKTLVVKRILPQLAARERFVEMFLAEARIAAQLSHQNIVQIFDFGEEDGGYFIAMEHVEGLNLRALVRWLKETGPLSPVLAAQIVMQACEGLAYAHDFVNPTTGQPLGLVHRDVSGENIMISRTGGVKVLDFGIARVAGEENGTRNGLLRGKIAYMPVEQLRAEELDRRVDVYALGVVLYQLLTGHRPYERPTEVGLITAILNEPPTPLTSWRPDLPAPLVAIVELAMARERDDRFADCRVLRDALERWVTSTGAVGSSAALASLASRALEAEAARAQKLAGLSVVFASSENSGESEPSVAPKRSSVQAIEFDADDKTNPDEALSPVPLGEEPDYFDRPRSQHAIPLQTQKAYPNPLADEFDARDEPPTSPQLVALPPMASVELPARTVTPTPVPAPTALPHAPEPSRFGSAAAALASTTKAEPAPVPAVARDAPPPAIPLSTHVQYRMGSSLDALVRPVEVEPRATAPSEVLLAAAGLDSPTDKSSRSEFPTVISEVAIGVSRALEEPTVKSPRTEPPVTQHHLDAPTAQRSSDPGPNVTGEPTVVDARTAKRSSGSWLPKASGEPAALEPPTSKTSRAELPTVPPTALEAKRSSGSSLPTVAGEPTALEGPVGKTSRTELPTVPPTALEAKRSSGSSLPTVAGEPAALEAPSGKTSRTELPKVPATPTPIAPDILPGTLLEAEPPARPAPNKAPSSSPSGLTRNQLAPAGFTTARLLAHTRQAVAPMAILGALRDGLATQRAQGVLRKLPPIAARLMETAADAAPRLDDTIGALVDAMLLADEHGVVAKVLEHFDARGGRFAVGLRAELTHPLRLLWLTERLRAGAPLHTSSLHSWLTRLGAAVVPALLQAIDELDVGAGQDFLCRALAGALGNDLAPVVERLETATGKRVAALSCVLEATGSVDRVRVFQKLLARRDPALTRQVMTGRAKLRTPEAVAMLEAGLGDRDEGIRLHAMRLLCEVGDPRTRGVLLTQVQHPLFDKRTDVERSGWWAALLEADDPATFTAAEEQLAQKTTLLGRKRSVAVKLAIVAALGEASRHEAARTLLERTAANKAQPDEVSAAAKAALQRAPSSLASERLSLEARAQLRRALVLDLAMTARAMTVVDLRGGALDPTLERLRAALRALVLQDGKLELSVRPDGVVLNGAIVPLVADGQEHGPLVARALHARDLQALAIDGPVPVGELRAFLLQQFDPAGASQRVAHVRVKTFTGRGPLVTAPLAATSAGRSVEAWRAAFDFVLGQRDSVRVGKPPAVDAADGFFEQWSRLYAEGTGQLLSVWPTEKASESRFAVHAANSASVAMAFASDLELGLPAVREVAELALGWALAELSVPDEKRTRPGEVPSEEVRLRLATLFLSQMRSRRGPAAAVAGIDLGLDARDPRRGPGVVPSIVALAETWDALIITNELDPLAALEQVNTTFRARFMPEVLDLFVQWARAQLGR